MSSKNPYNLNSQEPIGQLSSMTIKALIVGLIAVATSFGAKFVIDDATTDKIVAGIGSLVTMTSMLVAWWGRIRAVKVIDSNANPVIKSENNSGYLPGMAFLFLLPLLPGIGGCASTGGTPPLVQVYSARQAYTASLEGLTTALNAGQIGGADTVAAIRAVRAEVESGLDAAETKARAGVTLGFKFVMSRVNSALERFLLLMKPRPAIRSSLNTETPWTPQRFSLSFWPDRRCYPDWLVPTRLLIPGSLSPTSSRLSFAVNRPPLRPATTQL